MMLLQVCFVIVVIMCVMKHDGDYSDLWCDYVIIVMIVIIVCYDV